MKTLLLLSPRDDWFAPIRVVSTSTLLINLSGNRRPRFPPFFVLLTLAEGINDSNVRKIHPMFFLLQKGQGETFERVAKLDCPPLPGLVLSRTRMGRGKNRSSFYPMLASKDVLVRTCVMESQVS